MSVLVYCVKCKEKTETKNEQKVDRSDGLKMLKGNCLKCDSKKCSLLPGGKYIKQIKEVIEPTEQEPPNEQNDKKQEKKKRKPRKKKVKFEDEHEKPKDDNDQDLNE